MAANIRNILTNAGTAVSSRLTNAQTYTYPPDSVNQFPAIIPVLDSFDPTVAFGGNSFQGTLRVICLIERAEKREAWQRLYEHMDSTGSGTSVLAALRVDQRFGSAVDSSDLVRVENIGERTLAGGVYVGFDVLVSFITSVT